LSELTGYVIKISVPTAYAALVEAMGSGNAHIGWLPPLAYMLAKYKGYADVAWLFYAQALTIMGSNMFPMLPAWTRKASRCSLHTTILPQAKALRMPPPPSPAGWQETLLDRPALSFRLRAAIRPAGLR